MHNQDKILTIDLDGVICGSPYPFKLGINKKILNPKSEPPKAFVPPQIFLNFTDKIRYGYRPILPNIKETLEVLQKRRKLILLTGRRSSPTKWLEQNHIKEFFQEIIFNQTNFGSSHYKLLKIQEIGSQEHIDDDIQTIQLLNDRANCKLFFRTWNYNQEFSTPKNIQKINDFKQLVKLIKE
mgnify:CR=1 FL=1